MPISLRGGNQIWMWLLAILLPKPYSGFPLKEKDGTEAVVNQKQQQQKKQTLKLSQRAN